MERDAITPNRLIGLDLARSAALLAMVTYHFTYDLDLFGLIPRGTAITGWFWWHARLTAGSFILLAGLSLWLAHGRGIRWPAFWRRLARIAAAAALVTVGSHFALPGLTIFYGILHSIAVSSLVALLVLRWPALPTLALAAAVFTLPLWFRDPAFAGWLSWTGLAPKPPVTADFLPFFPWAAPLLAGVAVGRIFTRFNLWPALAPAPTPLLRALAWPGRHTLIIYLVHQPLMIGLFNLYFWLAA
ncbi:MAG: heparan-alpha-glucosaminide N-acetyltransferase [Paracoccaceae bacterium]